MDKKYGRKLEEIIRKSLERRGMDGIVLEGELERAAESILTGRTILIVTGFTIKSAMAGETDGPLGAVSLAEALGQLGKQVVIATDRYSANMLHNCITVKELECILEVIPSVNEDLFCKELLKRYRPTHIVAIERPGRAADGRCYTMRGEDISDMVPNTDILFEEGKKQGIATIAVGDGGNEVGMGKIKPYVVDYVCNGKQICAAVKTDFLIVAGVSNWGGHALSAALSILTRTMLLHDTDTEERLLKSLVEAGAVDGCTKKSTMTVDGLSLEENLSILELLRSAVESAVKRL